MNIFNKNRVFAVLFLTPFGCILGAISVTIQNNSNKTIIWEKQETGKKPITKKLQSGESKTLNVSISKKPAIHFYEMMSRGEEGKYLKKDKPSKPASRVIIGHNDHNGFLKLKKAR